MAYIGKTPTPQPLTATDIPDLPATKITSGTFPALNGSNLTNISAGKILQVKQTVKTSQFSSTSTSATDITGMSVSITPASSSNKIYCYVSTYVGHDTSDRVVALYLYRDSTLLYIGDANGSMTRVSGGIHTVHGTSQQNATHYSGISFLDSPSSTSALTYKIMGNCNNGTFTVNRAGDSYTGSERLSHSSSITVMEVSA
tara:strand:+ start:893 stop:1492 length:600 start_codon:yes stop_codon:yes gene_type:complete